MLVAFAVMTGRTSGSVDLPVLQRDQAVHSEYPVRHLPHAEWVFRSQSIYLACQLCAELCVDQVVQAAGQQARAEVLAVRQQHAVSNGKAVLAYGAMLWSTTVLIGHGVE
jgi:hypothetical protein